MTTRRYCCQRRIYLWLWACWLSLAKTAHGWSTTVDRRGALHLAQTLLLSLDAALPTATTTTPTTAPPQMPDAAITDKVFMDIRISRQDGSTYVRDDLPDTFENQVIYLRLKLGLYGKVAPNHAEKFLTYILPPKDNNVDNPFPSYGRSNFPALDQEAGLLRGGYISSLRLTEIGGNSALSYGSRILPATLWLEKNQPTNKISHSSKGLLTHRNLDPTPNFGITTRATPELDNSHTVFGQVLWDDETLNWFQILQDLPTYSVTRPVVGYDEFSTGGAAASAVFNAQRDLFRGAAKTLGDTRLDKIYEGKLLRRMEVLQVGTL
jgi:cyclophilin family peptidyl-prolyl cis-trans isomerase